MARLRHTTQDGKHGHSGLVPSLDVALGNQGHLGGASTFNRSSGPLYQPKERPSPFPPALPDAVAPDYPSPLHRDLASLANDAVREGISVSYAQPVYEPASASVASSQSVVERGRLIPEVRTLIVDDCTLHRENLAEIFAVLGAAEPTVAWDMPSLNASLGQFAPDIVLMSMITRDNVTLLRLIREKCPYAKVIVVGISDEDESAIVACAEAGVAGYHLRTESLDDLIDLISKVVEGESACSPRVSAILLKRLSTLASRRPVAQEELVLTAREGEILRMLKLGLSNREIAEQLCIAVHTVKNHVHSLLTKLGVNTRGQAAALANTAQ